MFNFKHKHKYNANKVEYNGIKFDSELECERYLVLLQKEELQEITDLRLQQKFELQPKFKYNGDSIRAINYIADFTYIQNGVLVVEDVKGFETTEFKIKKKILLYKYPNIQFKMIKKQDLYS